MKTGIFDVLSRDVLEDVLRTVAGYTELPVKLIDQTGSTVLQFGSVGGYCSLLQKCAVAKLQCDAMPLSAGIRAQQVGQAYVFSCHGELNSIAYPLVEHDALVCCVLLGPFLMDAPDSTLVSVTAERYHLSPAVCLDLYDELTDIKVISPQRVQLLMKLMEHLLSPLIPGERAFLQQKREKIFQQAQINETIQIYKEQEAMPSLQYFYMKEKELLTKVKTGDVSKIKGLLNDLLGYVLFSQGGNLESVRIRAVELTILLSRVAMEGGARAEKILELNNSLLPRLYAEQELDELCLLLQEIAENFVGAMYLETDKGNPHIRKALRYISVHYCEPLDLTTVAEEVQLSPGYFSELFRQTTGISFREHLCRVRVEQSKQLLLSTDYALADIAVSVGFPDQSYYCKVFRRIVGQTPGKFRH